MNLESYRSRLGPALSLIVTGIISNHVWGTNIYTDDSNIGAAAVHAEILNVGQPAPISLKILQSQSI